jgi:hypothetical protein
MATCLIVVNPSETKEQFEKIVAHVRSTGPFPPEGGRLMVAGPANPGWRVITVWDSEEARDRFFAERLAPAFKEAGVSFDSMQRTAFEVDTLIAGDLTGALQGA